MKKPSLLIILAAILTFVNFVLLNVQTEKFDQEVSKLKWEIEWQSVQYQSNQRELRRLRERMDGQYWASEDISKRLSVVEGR